MQFLKFRIILNNFKRRNSLHLFIQDFVNADGLSSKQSVNILIEVFHVISFKCQEIYNYLLIIYLWLNEHLQFILKLIYRWFKTI